MVYEKIKIYNALSAKIKQREKIELFKLMLNEYILSNI